MEPMLWKDEYCIGIEEIDKQHMDFLKLINRYMVLFDSGAHIRLQDRVLLEILKYVEYHLVSEENLMIIYKYTNLANQQEEHDALIKAFKTKCAGMKEGSVNGRDIIRYLISWFLNHTQKEDRKFAEYIMEKSNVQGND
jgi:hemerythrin